MDPFSQNILGVNDLVSDSENKTNVLGSDDEAIGSYEDILALPMSDDELLKLKEEYETAYQNYFPKIKTRQEANKLYYEGRQRNSTGGKTVSSNLLFEAEETFIPQALSKNPEPVVWSDNSDTGKEASNDIKTMLQYHADVLCLRKKLGVMVRHWSVYFIGVIKYGWDSKVNDIKLEVRNPKNFIFDPDGYVDEFGNFVGKFVGERIQTTAEDLMDLFPDKKEYIFLKVDGKLGTSVTRTEWWNDDYCFTTFFDEVLDKHKNEYFNYDIEEKGTDEYGLETKSVTPGKNHFAIPKMPFTFLSVFSFQEQPHDVTNLIEQNIPNQDRINDRDEQIAKNLSSANNSVVLSGVAFNEETAAQARDSFYEEGFLLVPNGDVERAVKRLPASDLPSAIFKAQENDQINLRQIFGTQGLTSQPNTNPETTARGMILNQSHDSTRIGGGIGDALEQVADNVFNWLLQLYFVFYDEPHYGAIMGSGRAVEYVTLINSNINRNFVVSVSPNSMAPKDEVSEQNMAVELYQQKALDPITLFKKLNYPDPMETAKQVAIWATNPALYMQMFFPESQPQPAQQPPQGQPVTPQEGTPPASLANPQASADLSNVPLNQ